MMEVSVKERKESFDTDKFVQFLLEEGVKIPCDETVESFNRHEALPSYYDEAMYKRGQKFFHDNIFALFFSKFLGLLTILALPTVIRVLSYTKMSGSSFTAYRRYMATIFHMCIWYQSDFTPGSKLWQSIMEVKNKHNSASKKCCTAGFNRISQKDMALTQFGFMGYALAKREEVGLHDIKEEDWKAFIHLWRVVGYVMGMEERFNICRSSVEETTAICQLLIERVLRPAFEKKDQEFVAMASYLTSGMWNFNPTVETKIYLNLVDRMLQGPNNNGCEFYVPLNLTQRIVVRIMLFVIWSLKFKIFKFYYNSVQIFSLWLMKVFPFLAYYSYGSANAHVNVLTDR